MADRSDTSKMPGVVIVWDVWKSEAIYSYKRSTDFSLLGETWYLELVFLRKFDTGCYDIGLRKRGNVELEPLTVITHILKNDSFKSSSGYVVQSYIARVNSSRTGLWRFDLDLGLPPSRNSKLTLMCTFIDIPPAMSKVLNETIEVTTQTDLPAQVKNLQDANSSSHEGEPEASFMSSNLDSLSRDLGKVLEGKILADVNLRCGDQKIAAHKVILAARSEVFSAMFQSKMLESETGVVDITDVDVNVLDLLLKYFYTGRLVEMADDDLPSLYAAGDKYAVNDLKRECSEILIKNLTEKNCFNFLLLADSHSDQDFKKAVLDFILEHMDTLKSEEWFKFREENITLSRDVLEVVVLQKCFS